MAKPKVQKSLRPVPSGWLPELWASPKPLGLGEQHPNNFGEVFRAIWENRDNLDYAYRILDQGVCDGCSLGSSGMKDWTITGLHLCNVRLRLLRLNTMAALDGKLLENVNALQSLRSRDLRELGRIPYPMIRRRGEPGFRRISWEEALTEVAAQIRASRPDQLYFYLTSRGVPNETYYAAQKAVRAIGTNNIDNAARICHSPSTFALKAALGVAATTCSYTDLIGTDLVVFFGSNVANNQPVMMKYLYYARKAGTKVAIVNPYREPAMERYWVPSDVESALFGTKIAEHFFPVQASGDVAFIHGTLKQMISEDWLNHDFIRNHTAGFEELRSLVNRLSWEELEAASGLSRQRMRDFACLIAEANRAVFVWGMGITQHTCGEDNVHAIVNLALSKGFVGREGCGLMPIRGHSGVQGGAEMGAYATAFPGGLPINEENAAKFSKQWGFAVPKTPGLTTPEMLELALQRELEVLWAMGGDFREVMPDPELVESALKTIRLRVHQDIVLSSQMLIEPEDTVVLLPSTTRYEIPGGVTETSTERRVIFSPEIPGPRMEEARSEWEVFLEIARRARPEFADKLTFTGTEGIREEIARVIPSYEGIQNLKKRGDSFQYGGPMLCAGWKFSTADRKAHFKAVSLPQIETPAGAFRVVTRRGKQFNSMVQEDLDASTAAARNAVLMNPLDARRLGLASGDQVRLQNDFGTYDGKVLLVPVIAGTLEIYWPEGNVLVDPKARSPLAKIPAYKEISATLERASGAEQPEPVWKRQIENPQSMTQEATKQGLPNRWLLAGGGVLMQLALGAVYAWSVFRNPLSKQFGWSIPDVTTTFSIAILVLGFAAFIGGLWMRRVGPRIVGITAGICYGLGVALASLANGNIWVLWLTYGGLGGLGLGLGYIVPLATLVKWFPDRRGFITGLAVAGFGAGALITAPLAQYLIDGVGVVKTLAILGIDYMIMVVLGAAIMRNPPEGWMPKGWQPSVKQQEQLEARNYTLKEALSTWQWYALWAMLFLNVTAGISIISQASPMAQEISGVSAAVGAGMVGVISIANGIGRLLWAWLSDAIGRRSVFLTMFLLQAVLFFILPSLRQFTMLALVCCIIISCFGGGFGTMPAFAADYFGPKWVGSIYGLMLTAWGFAGVFGPLLIANIRQATGNYVGALIIIACILLVSSLLPIVLRRHVVQEVVHAKPVGRA